MTNSARPRTPQTSDDHGPFSKKTPRDELHGFQERSQSLVLLVHRSVKWTPGCPSEF
jgi:hypothetical protein